MYLCRLATGRVLGPLGTAQCPNKENDHHRSCQEIWIQVQVPQLTVIWTSFLALIFCVLYLQYIKPCPKGDNKKERKNLLSVSE